MVYAYIYTAGDDYIRISDMYEYMYISICYVFMHIDTRREDVGDIRMFDRYEYVCICHVCFDLYVYMCIYHVYILYACIETRAG